MAEAAFTPGQYITPQHVAQTSKCCLPATSNTSNMLPGNMLLVAGNMLPVSRQHVSFCIQQQTGDKLATILLTTTSNMLPCKRGFIEFKVNL